MMSLLFSEEPPQLTAKATTMSKRPESATLINPPPLLICHILSLATDTRNRKSEERRPIWRAPPRTLRGAVVTPRSYYRLVFPLSPRPLRLPCVLRGVDPGLHGVAVVLVLQPGPRCLRIILRVDVLYLVDLILGKRQRLHEGVGYGVIVREVLVDDRRDRRPIVQVTKGVLWVLKILKIVPLVHPVRPPGHKGELLLVVITAVYLGEHARCARLHVLLLKTVRRYDAVGYPLRDDGARLDTEDLGEVGVVEVGDGVDVRHIGRHAYTELGRALVLGGELHDIVFDLAKLGLVIWQPHVLERGQVAATHALEHGTEFELLEPYHPVAE